MKKPIILAIETATEACSAALLYDEKIAYRHEITAREHTRLLLPMIQSLLNEAQRDIREVNAISVGQGPGSFTGVRVAVSCAQGLGFALNIPIYAISTLEALAYQAMAACDPAKAYTIIAAIDARMQEIYASAYQVQDQQLTGVIPEMVCAPLRMSEEIAALSAPCVMIGSGADVYAEKLRTSALPVELLANRFPHAQDIAKLANAKIVRGEKGQIAKDVLPVYLRDNVAEKAKV